MRLISWLSVKRRRGVSEAGTEFREQTLFTLGSLAINSYEISIYSRFR